MSIAKLIETVNIAISQLSVNKMRTALTMLGITIGVAAVIILISVGQGIEDFIVGQFDLFGSRMVYVATVQEPGSSSGDITAQPEAGEFVIKAALTQSDYGVLTNKALVPDAEEIAYILAINELMVYEDETASGFVVGVSDGYFEIMQMSAASGRLINEDDLALSDSGRCHRG